MFPGGMGGNTGGLALNQLLIVMDGIGDPPFWRRFWTNRVNTFLDASYIVPGALGNDVAAAAEAEAAHGADLLRRRLQRARSRCSIPR